MLDLLVSDLPKDSASEGKVDRGRRRTPLVTTEARSIKCAGPLQFALIETVMRGEFRPLREPYSTISILTPESIAASGIMA